MVFSTVLYSCLFNCYDEIAYQSLVLPSDPIVLSFLHILKLSVLRLKEPAFLNKERRPGAFGSAWPHGRSAPYFHHPRVIVDRSHVPIVATAEILGYVSSSGPVNCVRKRLFAGYSTIPGVLTRAQVLTLSPLAPT